MRIIDGRTKEGKNELEVKRQFEKLLIMTIFDNSCKKVPGEFIEKYRTKFPVKDLKSEYINKSLIR